MTADILTQEELKSQLHYDPDTGIFTRIASFGSRAIIGAIAGTNHNCGYLRTTVNKKSYLLHRLAWLYMYGEFPTDLIDHINCVRTDNKLSNLRLADKELNGINRGKNKNNTSGFKGVSFDKKNNKWFAQCYSNKHNNFLGYFETPEIAHIAHEEFSKEKHGEFHHE